MPPSPLTFAAKSTDMKIKRKHFCADLCLILVISAVALLLLLPNGNRGNEVRLSLNGDVIGVYPLDKDAVIEVNDKDGVWLNTVCIKNGAVYVKSASCKGGDCTKHSGVSREGQCIVCLPNGLVVLVCGNGDIDGVVGFCDEKERLH